MPGVDQLGIQPRDEKLNPLAQGVIIERWRGN
jgi:hypothetical protein